jgi:hemerythrin superfamily protein
MRPFKSAIMRKASTLFAGTPRTNKQTSTQPIAKISSPSQARAKADAAADSLKAPQAQDAIALLKADHKLMLSLFKDYAKARTSAQKKVLVARICTELTIHTQLEEELFYPAVKRAMKDKVLIPEASVEHDTLRLLLSQVEGAMKIDDMFNARIKVLAKYVRHHVMEEHKELFPQASATTVDMLKLGQKMAARKAELSTA